MQVFSTSKRTIQNGSFVSVTRTRWSKATRKFKRLIGRWEHQSLSIYSCKAKRFTEAKKRAHTPEPLGFWRHLLLAFHKRMRKQVVCAFLTVQGRDCEGEHQSQEMPWER